MDGVRPDRNNSKKDNGDRPKPASRNRARKSSHGTSRRSILKKSFAQEQVGFSGSIGDDPVVGNIGGGMSGLVCALELEKRGVQFTVFDKGMHGLGGRMGTRMIDPERLVFDHAAQFFTVSDDQFAAMVKGWLEEALVQEWNGSMGELRAGCHFLPLPSTPQRYIGVGGMRLLADSLLSKACDDF